MVEARVYVCPVCGAFAREGERACRHCQTALATLRCPHCFELSFPDDLHCRGCGRELGLFPIPTETTLPCPDCQQPLQAFSAAAGELAACDRCGGQMVAHELLRALLEQREALGRAVPTPAAAPRGNPLADRVRYRACPHCRQMMNRKNFGGTSGIVVDVCALHGTFFDAGELPRVLEFVRRGGLAKAQPALSNQGPSSGRVASAGVLPAPAPTTLLDDLAGLASFVVEVLTRR
jgi:Zn-finger nucleic acid-binding protein